MKTSITPLINNALSNYKTAHTGLTHAARLVIEMALPQVALRLSNYKTDDAAFDREVWQEVSSDVNDSELLRNVLGDLFKRGRVVVSDCLNVSTDLPTGDHYATFMLTYVQPNAEDIPLNSFSFHILNSESDATVPHRISQYSSNDAIVEKLSDAIVKSAVHHYFDGAGNLR